jgi:hypothetical protein
MHAITRRFAAASQEYGRFASLSSGLRVLSAPERPGQSVSNPE